MQPAGNDLYGFYVMHYMHSLINALFGSQVWPLGSFSKFGRSRDILRVCSKAFLNCVSPFSCVPDWSVIYTGADRFGDIWVPRRSFRFDYRQSREPQGSPSPSLIKVLVFWKLYIRCCWMPVFENYVCRCRFVWIFVSRWWCMFGYNTLSLSIYVAGDV